MSKLENIIKAVSTIKNGTMCRVTYKSELPVKAEFKHRGIKVVKYTEATVRFGVNYNNIKTVIEKKNAENYTPTERTYDRTWLVDNKIFVNNKNGNPYVRIANVRNHANKNSIYSIIRDNKDIRVEQLSDSDKELIINSYWNRPYEMPEIQDINADNIISIKDIVLV